MSRLEMIGELMMLLRLASALASAEAEKARGDVACVRMVPFIRGLLGGHTRASRYSPLLGTRSGVA